MLEGNYFSSSHQVFATELSALVTIWYLTSFFILILLGKNVLSQSCSHPAQLLFFCFCPFIFYVLKTLIWGLEEQLKVETWLQHLWYFESIFVLLLVHRERQYPLGPPWAQHRFLLGSIPLKLNYYSQCQPRWVTNQIMKTFLRHLDHMQQRKQGQQIAI